MGPRLNTPSSSHLHNHAPTPGSPTRICANCPSTVVGPVAPNGERPPISGPPGLALAGPTVSLVVLLGPYGFGSEFWRWRPCVTMRAGKPLEDVPGNGIALLLLLLLSFCSRLRSCGGWRARIRDARDKYKGHRLRRIRPTLNVVLCPRLHILVRIRCSRVEHKRWARQRLPLFR